MTLAENKYLIKVLMDKRAEASDEEQEQINAILDKLYDEKYILMKKGGGKMTAKEIAKECGCSVTWVYIKSKRLGLKNRLATPEEMRKSMVMTDDKKEK